MRLIDQIGKLFQTAPRHQRTSRSSGRVATTIRARFPGSSFSCERAGNVSADGFCFEHDGALPVGSRVRVLIELPGTNNWIRATGEVLGSVAWGEMVGNRGRFVHIDSDDRELLTQWLGRHIGRRRAA